MSDKERVVKCQETVKVVASDVLREIVEQAHMAGQIDAGVDPSYSNARAYYDGLFSICHSNQPEVESD